MNQSTDPIVQLRQVCKQIVIWLRSLYCWSRMLPAQALRSQNTQNNAIGFSIYVVSEGNDDVTGLISQQGFSSQSQPHSVATPYGELGWKVFYAPKSVVQRLIPEVSPYSHSNSTSNRTSSQPIPMQSQQSQQSQAQSFHPSRDLMRRDSTPVTATARSAPHNTGRAYQRSKSDISGDAEHYFMSVGGNNDGMHTDQQQIAQVQHTIQNLHGASGTTGVSTTDPPTKTLSALSLAMMTLSDHDDSTGVNGSIATCAANVEAAEKRRAALHHAPPQLPQQSSPSVNKKSPLASAGEYGYGYNNHIPTMRANNTPPSMNPLSSPSSTPVPPLGSTPPGYLLGGPTPPLATNWSNLIPPRGAVTPPFTRPMGFVGEPPNQPLPPAASSGHRTTNQKHFSATMAPGQQPNVSSAPTTSLDLLHSSPFRQPIYGSNYVSGSSMAAAAEPFPSMSSGIGGPGDVAFFSSSPGSGMYPRLQALDDPDDMPFAVDYGDDADTGPSTSTSLAAASSSSTMIMRGMIQPPKRLQLFESTSGESNIHAAITNDLSSFADQLAEFKNFGASLMLHSVDSSGEIDSSSGAAISLRT